MHKDFSAGMENNQFINIPGKGQLLTQNKARISIFVRQLECLENTRFGLQKSHLDHRRLVKAPSVSYRDQVKNGSRERSIVYVLMLRKTREQGSDEGCCGRSVLSQKVPLLVRYHLCISWFNQICYETLQVEFRPFLLNLYLFKGGGQKLVHPSQRKTLDSSHSQKTLPSRSLRTPDYISSSSWER